MSWNIFRRNVLATMRSNPSGPDQIARAIATSYDMALRSPGSGDLINKHYLVKGNARILEIWINSSKYNDGCSGVIISNYNDELWDTLASGVHMEIIPGVKHKGKPLYYDMMWC